MSEDSSRTLEKKKKKKKKKNEEALSCMCRLELLQRGQWTGQSVGQVEWLWPPKAQISDQ